MGLRCGTRAARPLLVEKRVVVVRSLAFGHRAAWNNQGRIHQAGDMHRQAGGMHHQEEEVNCWQAVGKCQLAGAVLAVALAAAWVAAWVAALAVVPWHVVVYLRVAGALGGPLVIPLGTLISPMGQSIFYF